MSPKRNPMFTRSDISGAAEELIEVMAEHADSIWHEDEKAELVERLTDKAFLVIRDKKAAF